MGGDMKTKTISKKIIVSVLILAFILPFIFTGIYSEASETKASLQQNMNTYGFNVDLNNMKIEITKSVTRYGNAADANNKANGLQPYDVGTYYVYKSVNGAINISKQANSPGSWISARDLAGKTKSNNKVNTGNASNINAATVKLNKGTKVYVSAEEAVNGLNSKASYSAGTYYVYKSTKSATNITKVKGQPGAWVPKSALSNATPTEIKKPDSSKVENKPSKKAPTNITSSNGKIVISGGINIYMTAADALNGTNSRGSWSAGTYDIYKSYGKAINITTQPGQPGSWIDGSKLNTNNKKDKIKPAPVQNTHDTVVLNTDVKVYGNAYDAISGTNPAATFSKGTYYIYKTYGNTINISAQKGQPGGWIIADVKSIPASGVKTDSNTIKTGKQFVLVLDPGHGEGIAHNRGGLLFNEGDQNYKFTQSIINEASKYSNIIVKTTRTYNSEDPSFEDRAKSGNGADLFVSIHSNAAKANVRGVEAWGSQKNSKTGQNFANDLTKTWSEVMSTPNRGVMYDYKDARGNSHVALSPDSSKDDTWFVFKGNNAKEKVLLESVFHTNLQDSQVYLNNQERLAREFMNLVAKNFGIISR